MLSEEKPPYEDEYLYPITDALDFNANADDAYKTFEPYSIVLDGATNAAFAANDKYVLRLFHGYLAFATEMYVTGNESGELVIGDAAFKPFAEKFVRLLNETYPKYEPQLVAYEANEGKLLNTIKTTTDSKNAFSDAPQTATIESDEGTDELANLSKAHAESNDDGGTPIMRLKEIHDSIASIYAEWYYELERTLSIQ